MPTPTPSSQPLWRSVLVQIHRIFRPVLDLRSVLAGIQGYPKYIAHLYRYLRMLPAEPGRKIRLFPILGEDTSKTGFEPHYLYLGDWALRHVLANPAAEHVDVGSQLHWVVSVAASKPITFIDIRPADMDILNLRGRSGSLMALPYGDKEVLSLSCLHVIEHIGLGRYGDPLDPDGTHKSIRELARILAPAGSLLVALPIGRSQLVFNAHRVHGPSRIIEWFRAEGLTLRSFAAVDDSGKYLVQADPADFESAHYACGMFEFTR